VATLQTIPLTGTADMLEYNGVVLKMVHVVELKKEAVYDDLSGVDFLGIRISLSAVCVWNPYATASQVGGDKAPPRAPGDRVGFSLALLRQALLEPRKQLFLRIGPDNVVESPALDAFGRRLSCDVANGPFPEVLDVKEIVGYKSAIVVFRITTTLLDTCQNIVLSNRWSMAHEVDEDHYCRRVIRGRVVVRTDLLYQGGIFQDPNSTNLDNFRKNFAFSVPDGMRRKSVDVLAQEDGTAADYTVVDEEQGLNLATSWPARRTWPPSRWGSPRPSWRPTGATSSRRPTGSSPCPVT
jgi:hypothetical protein